MGDAVLRQLNVIIDNYTHIKLYFNADYHKMFIHISQTSLEKCH